jgi:iron complex transport system ATP-binding protein
MSIVIEGLAYDYGSIPALRDVTAAAVPGAITVVVGPNAAGKSTLLRCIIGSLTPRQGAALLDGVPSHKLSVRVLARRVAHVAQRPAVSAAFRVREVVALGRYALPPSPAMVESAMRRLDLLDLAERPYPDLSVGQQQRVMVARALAQLAPDGHLVMDEPIASLDLRHVVDCFALWRQLAQAGATILMTMHDLSLAAAIADHVWLLADGRLVAAGPPADVLALDRLRTVFGVEFAWHAGSAGRKWLIPRIEATPTMVPR